MQYGYSHLARLIVPPQYILIYNYIIIQLKLFINVPGIAQIMVCAASMIETPITWQVGQRYPTRQPATSAPLSSEIEHKAFKSIAIPSLTTVCLKIVHTF